MGILRKLSLNFGLSRKGKKYPETEAIVTPFRVPGSSVVALDEVKRTRSSHYLPITAVVDEKEVTSSLLEEVVNALELTHGTYYNPDVLEIWNQRLVDPRGEIKDNLLRCTLEASVAATKQLTEYVVSVDEFTDESPSITGKGFRVVSCCISVSGESEDWSDGESALELELFGSSQSRRSSVYYRYSLTIPESDIEESLSAATLVTEGISSREQAHTPSDFSDSYDDEKFGKSSSAVTFVDENVPTRAPEDGYIVKPSEERGLSVQSKASLTAASAGIVSVICDEPSTKIITDSDYSGKLARIRDASFRKTWIKRFVCGSGLRGGDR